MNRVTVVILGATTVWKLSEVREVLGERRFYRRANAEDLYVDLPRAEANLIVASLRNTPGVQARILE